MFLFVVVSRQTKKAISLRLCGYILEEFFPPNLEPFAYLPLDFPRGPEALEGREPSSPGNWLDFELGRGCG